MTQGLYGQNTYYQSKSNMGLKGCDSTTFTEGKWLSFDYDGVALVVFFWWINLTFSSFGVGAPIIYLAIMTCAHMFLKKTYTQGKTKWTNWIT